MKQRDNASWLSELKGEPVKAPRREKLQDLVDSRPFWDGLADLSGLPEGVEVHEDVVLWDRGERTLTAEIYVPDGPGPYPLFLHIHGGGYCVSSARNDRKWGMRVAERGFTVISPDYGLAPEHPFPWAVEDCLYAARWFTKHGAEYKGDPSRLVIEGGSAGAGLSAATLVALNGLADDIDQATWPVSTEHRRRDPLLRDVQLPAAPPRAGLERRLCRAVEPRVPWATLHDEAPAPTREHGLRAEPRVPADVRLVRARRLLSLAHAGPREGDAPRGREGDGVDRRGARSRIRQVVGQRGRTTRGRPRLPWLEEKVPVAQPA